MAFVEESIEKRSGNTDPFRPDNKAAVDADCLERVAQLSLLLTK